MPSRLSLIAAAVAGALSLLALLSGSGDGLRPPPAFADHCAVRPSVSRPVLRSGSSGDQVAVLQVGLLNAGHPSLDPNGNPYIDGLFGSPEAAAVSGFQQSRGLPATGVVDDATWSALDPFIDKTDRHPAPQPPYGQLTASFNAAAFNNLYPGHPYFGLQAIETGPGAARQLTTPYVPPTLLKAVGWVEASWRQADGGGAPVISFDCGYGVMQITAPGLVLAGMNWSMYGRAPEPVYSQVQVPLASDFNVNLALGAKTLVAKWNLAPEFRPVVGGGNPGIIEDWYYALWSYNGFVSSNHPDRFNAIYPLRGEYSCNLSDGFNHNRTQFAYQELVFGCIKHPAVLNGVALWSGIPVTLPASVPPFDPSAMDIPTPQPAHGDPTPGTLPPAVAIDAPAGTVAQPFVIAGWAVDYAAPSGTGIDAIHVYAYPSDAAGTPIAPPQFLGAAAMGGSRPDVATTFGNPNFASAGYGLAVRGVSPGFYNLVVYARSTVTGQWYAERRALRVENAPAMALDVPRPNATVPRPFLVAGWAIDHAAAQGTGVDAVHVYAYPADASGAITGSPILVGGAQYGLPRPDVGAIYGSQFTNSGYQLWGSGLPPGFYSLVAYAHSTVSGAWQHSQRTFWLPPPAMALDAPCPNAAVQQPFLVAGWAIDRAAAEGTGVDAVHVYAFPADASGAVTGAPPIFLGGAQYGFSRPDVGAVYGSQFTNSGYQLWVSGLPPGYYSLVAYAHSTTSGAWQYSQCALRAA